MAWRRLYTDCWPKACEKQKGCRDKAIDLIAMVEPFLEIEHHVQALRARKETQRAVEVMLGLISDIADYIREKTNRSIIGVWYAWSSESET